MPSITKPVEINHAVQTTQGEMTVNINLTLNIKIDESGKMIVSAIPVQENKREELIILPDIDPINEKDLIEFGEDVN